MKKQRRDAGTTGRRAATPQPPYQLEFYRDAAGRELVLDWLRSLPLAKRKVIGAAMHKILQHEGAGVCDTQWGRPLGQGLFEFRVRMSADAVSRERQLPPEEILLRVFCHAHGDKIVLLVNGYDKATDVSARRQNAEIAEARRRLADWKRRQRAGPT